MWAELHGAAERFDPWSFAPFVRRKIEEIPCGNCKDGSIAFAEGYPPEHVQSRMEAMYWMCQFHNQASLDAGNGLVDCINDPYGYGYISGHRPTPAGMGWAGYGGGGGGQQQRQGKGGRQQRGKGRNRMQQQQPQQDGSSGWWKKKTIMDLACDTPGACRDLRRTIEGTANCICVRGIWTGLGCPSIGKSCIDPHAENIAGAHIHYPVGHPSSSQLKAGFAYDERLPKPDKGQRNT